METPFSQFKVNGSTQFRANNSVVKSLTPKFELIQDFMPVLVTCKFDKDLIKDE